MQTLIDERALSKLRWRCRRGLLENDLFIERFFAGRQDRITTDQAAGLGALMDLPDNDLLDLLLRRTEPEGELQRNDVTEVLALMRAPRRAHEMDEGPIRARTVETNPPLPPTRNARNHHDPV
jgi:antitoxin CptB